MKIKLIYCLFLFLIILLLYFLLALDSWGSFWLNLILFGSLIDEKRLSLSQVAQRLDVNTSTVWRWALKGVRGVKLDTFSIGAKRYTTEESVNRFIEGTTRSASGDSIPIQSSRTNRQREAAVSDAERFLDSESI